MSEIPPLPHRAKERVLNALGEGLRRKNPDHLITVDWGEPVTRELARDMSDAHAEGLHAELPREGCPDCEGHELRDYPTAAELAERKRKRGS